MVNKRFILLLSAVLILPSLVQGAVLVSVADTPSNVIAGAASTTHTISFKTASSDTIAKVTIAFKPGFTLGSVTKGAVTGLSTGTLSVSGDTVIYTVTTPETVSAGTACTITLGNITNAATCTTTYTVIISTRTSADTIIDGPTTSNTFALLSNSLKVTTPPQVILSGDTSSIMRVIACDIYGNTDVLFNNTVTLSGSSPSRQFLTVGNPWTNSVDTYANLISGAGQFYYRDTGTGEVSVSVSRSGYTSYIQSFKITPFLTSFIPPDTSVTVILSSGGTTITIPSGTFSSTICLAINDTPTSTAITNANNSSAADPSGSLKLVSELGVTVREIAAFAVSLGIVDYSQPLNPQAGKYVTITIPYNNPAVSGSLEDGLRICRLDETTQGWILLTGTHTINKSAKTVSTDITSFSFYRLISLGIAQDLASVIVYPNPFEFSKARDGTLKFVNLPTQATIKIYNVAGELVRTIPKDNTTNRATWDGKNEYGEKVATGIYIYVISSIQDTARKITGKIAVIASE